jgi:putative spermidine/putrescine transport system ATP-binding protein
MRSRDADAPLVRFVNVDKTFDSQALVIDDLNLEIRTGGFLTLLGPSGSGKTTTLMMLAGFEMPTRGDIWLAGRSIRNLPPYKRDIGVVFQNLALFSHMTVGENVGFPLLARRVRRAERARRVSQALDMVHSGVSRPADPGSCPGGNNSASPSSSNRSWYVVEDPVLLVGREAGDDRATAFMSRS